MSKVLLLGDSITYYLPKSKIGNSSDVIYNRGIENIGIETYRNYVLPHTEYKRADIIVILIGINNILRPDCDYDSKESLDNLMIKYNTLVSDIKKESNAKLIIQSIYPTKELDVNKKVEYINEKLMKYCKDNNIQYLNLYNDLILNGVLNKNYSNDGLHPNMEGYELITDKINKAILSLNHKR